MVDSLELYKEAFGKAVYTIERLKSLNDTTFAISAQKMEQMNTALVTQGGRHFIGIILGFLFLTAMGALLIWKGRKIKSHYDGLIEYSNLATQKVIELEERIQEFDEDYVPLKDELKPVSSRWPKLYIHIIYGSILAFFFIYFMLSF